MPLFAVLFFGLMLLQATGALAQDEGAGGWLGVEIKDLQNADARGGSPSSGVELMRPRPGSPAEAAGLQPGDIIVLINGAAIENGLSLRNVISSKAAGAEVEVTVRR